MNLLVVFVSLATLFILYRRFGFASFLGAGYVGLFVYSIPVFISKARYFYYLDSEFYLYSPTADAMLVYLIVWVVFLLFVAFKDNGVLYKSHAFGGFSRLPSRDFLWSGVFLSAVFFVYVVYSGAQQSHSVSDTHIHIVGRWVFALTAIAAVVNRKPVLFVVMSFFLLHWFLSGDRTLIGITLMSIMVVYARNVFKSPFVHYRYVFNLKVVVTVCLVVLLITFGKYIHVAISKSKPDLLLNLLQGDNLVIFFSTSFEPMIIFNHVQHVIDNSLKIPVQDFLISIFANLLVYPSKFGFNTNLYSDMLVSSMEVEMSYGVAGNFWAHAYSVFGYFGVGLFSLGYIYFLFFCDKVYLNGRGSVRILIALLGGLVSLYVHRNGLDNVLSFVRQMIIAYFVVVLISFFYRVIFSCRVSYK